MEVFNSSNYLKSGLAKFIFLDFDGVMDTVLHTNRLYHEGLPESDRYGTVFDPDCVTNLQKIVDSTGAAIVVTSSWKDIMGYEKILEMWTERRLPGFVIDVTPTCSNHRGDEIDAWLNIFTKYSGISAYQYVIIDDMGIVNFNPNHVGHLVCTDWYEGLNTEKAEDAIRILNGF